MIGNRWKKTAAFLCAVLALAVTGGACSNLPEDGPKESAGPAATEMPEPAATPAPEPTKAPTPEPTPEPTPTPAGLVELSEGFSYREIPEEVFRRMLGKSYPEECPVPLDDLRYVKVLHVGFDGESHEGEMIVNKRIADDVVEIFKELYEAEYPIERIRLIDEYDASDEASMTDNNTSCFCYRTISGSNQLSYHARGLAVDVNTLYNPYVSKKKIEPAAGKKYAYDRDSGNPYYIDEDDLCYKLFTEHGFFWGGHWNSVKDYQHFEMQD